MIPQRMPKIQGKQIATRFVDKAVCNSRYLRHLRHTSLPQICLIRMCSCHRLTPLSSRLLAGILLPRMTTTKPSNMSSTFTTSWSLYLNRILGHRAPHCSQHGRLLQLLPRFFICKARRAPEEAGTSLARGKLLDCGTDPNSFSLTCLVFAPSNIGKIRILLY